MDENLDLIPPEGDPEVGHAAYKIVSDIILYKSDNGLHDRWIRNYELGRNEHWKNKNVKISLVTANFLHKHRLRTCNLLTDNNPTFNVKIHGKPEQQEAGQKILRTNEYIWRETGQQQKLSETVHNGETYGSTIEKIVFDQELEAGLGEVDTIIVDPFYFGVWPLHCRYIKKADAVAYYYPMDVRAAKRRWKEHAKDIKADTEIIRELGDSRHEIMSKGANKGMLTRIGGVVRNLLGVADTGRGEISDTETLVCEVWVRDTSGRYTGNIRRVTVCSGGDVVLADEDNPSINPDLPDELKRQCYLFDQFPFIHAQSQIDTTCFWGPGDFEQAEQLQIEINKCLSQFNMVKDKTVRAKLKNPKTSGVKNEELNNSVGIINPSNAMEAEGIKYVEPPINQFADLINGANLYKELLLGVLGTFDIDQANVSGNQVIAHKAIAALIENVSIMNRGKIRSYSNLVTERGRMITSLVQNWYTEERYIAYDEGGEDESMTITGQELIVPLKLSVVSGSTLPVSKIYQREESINMFKAGIVDRQHVLETFEINGWRDIMTRMKEGPLGEFIKKLQALTPWMPQQYMQYLIEIMKMPEKDFIRELKAQRIQPLPPPQEQGKNPMQDIEMQTKMVEIEYKKAETTKKQFESIQVQAQVKKIAEEIATERIKQMVAQYGIKFDEQKLMNERAKIVAEIEAKLSDNVQSADKSGRGAYAEKGLKSNNLENTD